MPVLVDFANHEFISALKSPEFALPEAWKHSAPSPLNCQLIKFLQLFPSTLGVEKAVESRRKIGI